MSAPDEAGHSETGATEAGNTPWPNDVGAGVRKWWADVRNDVFGWFLHRRGWAVVILGLFIALSIPALGEVIRWWLLVVAGVIGLFLVAGVFSHYIAALDLVAGAVVAPWLCLIGFNWLSRRWPGGEIDFGLWPGLVLAGALFALAAAAYLFVWRERRISLVIVAILLGATNVVGLPLLLADRHKSHVSGSEKLVTKIDFAIVVPEAHPDAVPENLGERTDEAWNRRWSVSRLKGSAVDWLLLDSPDALAARTAARGTGSPLGTGPAWRDDADHVVLLDVDGTPPVTPEPDDLRSVDGRPGEVARWLAVAERAAPGARVLVLLQTTDAQRFGAWTRAVEEKGGSVATAQELGATSLTDAAQALAVQSAGTRKDLQIALRFRPVLLFDSGEKQHTPYEIESFLHSGRVTLCHDDQASGHGCDRPQVIRGSAELVNGRTHLKIRDHRRSDPEIDSAIYVHATEHDQPGRRLLYLDYWWYLPANPARVGHGASCGIGLAIPGKTCFDHPSDWEGITVVVDRSGAEPVPVALQLAQHKHVVRYDYSSVREYWTDLRRTPARLRRLKRQLVDTLGQITDIDQRPLAFVARGTHATYVKPCPPDGPCRQVVDKDVPENAHDGVRSWSGNDTATCVKTSCVRLLPTRNGGRSPALWNAYDGVWGDQRCIIYGTYCNVEKSPNSPGAQPRYTDPVAVDAWADVHGKAHRCGGDEDACPEMPRPSP
jgi:hypothetical protein